MMPVILCGSDKYLMVVSWFRHYFPLLMNYIWSNIFIYYLSLTRLMTILQFVCSAN